MGSQPDIFLTFVSGTRQESGCYTGRPAVVDKARESAVKPLPTMMFASVMMAALAAADARRMTLVKGSPTTDSFDISWVDNATQKYYLSDRTNNAIDLVDAATDTFLGSIGQGQYTGSRPVRAGPTTCGTVPDPMEWSRTTSATCGPEMALATSLKPARRSRERPSSGKSPPVAGFGLTKSRMTRSTRF
jgi:hypothetical protein